MPDYCFDCHCLGHSSGSCPTPASQPATKETLVWRPKTLTPPLSTNPHSSAAAQPLHAEPVDHPQSPLPVFSEHQQNLDQPSSSNPILDPTPPLIPDDNLEKDSEDNLVKDPPLSSPLITLPDFSTTSDPFPDYFSKDDTAMVLYKPPALTGPKIARSQSFSTDASLSLVLPRSAQIAELRNFSARIAELLFHPVQDKKSRRRRQLLPLKRTMVTRSQHAALLALPSNV